MVVHTLKFIVLLVKANYMIHIEIHVMEIYNKNHILKKYKKNVFYH